MSGNGGKVWESWRVTARLYANGHLMQAGTQSKRLQSSNDICSNDSSRNVKQQQQQPP